MLVTRTKLLNVELG